MKNRERILAEFQAVPENTLIMTGKLYREKFSKQMSETAFTQAISRLSDRANLKRHLLHAKENSLWSDPSL